MELQKTIARTTMLQGKGLFGGVDATITFHPAPDDHGVVFIRKDMDATHIPALVQNVTHEPRRTTLRRGAATIATCEHCLSALAGLRIDNIIVEVEGPELPALDGSAQPYLEALDQAGLESLTRPRRSLVVTEPIIVEDRGAVITALPSDQPGMKVIYDLEYPPDTPIPRQVASFDSTVADYARDFAPARTFVLESEVEQLREAGFGAHLTPDDVLVIAADGPMGANSFRFADEPVRHKMVDLLGDFYLLGASVQGRIIAHRSGHALNHAMVRALHSQYEKQRRHELAIREPKLDIRTVSRILPHRYPMLLVDRVVELEGDQRAVGIKNVTINEPFFQGHYPGTPIMPGVLIVEAMAQLSGVLIGQKLEHTGKLAVLLSLDNVKLRRPVTPGDQLIMEARSVRVRSRIAHMRCRAFVGDHLAAEAEVKFMLVDDEQA